MKVPPGYLFCLTTVTLGNGEYKRLAKSQIVRRLSVLSRPKINPTQQDCLGGTYERARRFC
jgi:hypothetical protein